MDEVHQLPDPSRLLKIGADTRQGLKILATGSSTLAATRKFRDSLAGRKRSIHLLPVLVEELPAFGVTDLRHRLFRGGLPEALLARHDEKRAAFMLLLETLLRQSGGLIEHTSLTRACGLSRPTIVHSLDVLQVTHAVHLLRPFHGGGRQELLHQPKVDGFDTGFVCHARGFGELRTEDCGLLWEHVVLDTLLSIAEPLKIHFWRDKRQREIDFVVPRPRGPVDVIECRWDPEAFDAKALGVFREIYPEGRNFVVAPIGAEHYERTIQGLRLTITNLAELRRLLQPPGG